MTMIKRFSTIACFAIALPGFASQPAGVTLKAVPNQSTSFPASAFLQSAATNNSAGISLSGPYTGMNGTVTLCEGSISYTPAFGFNGTDTFSVALTNSAGVVGSALATILVQPVSGLVMQPDHSVQLQLVAAAGSNYIIQASTNLLTWTNIGTALAGTNGVLLFNDTNAASFPFRYYRLSAP